MLYKDRSFSQINYKSKTNGVAVLFSSKMNQCFPVQKCHEELLKLLSLVIWCQLKPAKCVTYLSILNSNTLEMNTQASCYSLDDSNEHPAFSYMSQ